MTAKGVKRLTHLDQSGEPDPAKPPPIGAEDQPADPSAVAMVETIEEMVQPDFEAFANLILEWDEPPPVDPRLAAFIDDFATFCASLYRKGFVPDARDELPFIRQYVRAYDGRRKQRRGGTQAPRDRSRR